jgi:hypothetical protein
LTFWVLVKNTQNRSLTIIGRSMTIGQVSKLERGHLSPLAEKGFPIYDLLYPLVADSKGRVKVKTNWYSTPLRPGLRVMASVGPLTVEICATRGNSRGQQCDRLQRRLSECLFGD